LQQALQRHSFKTFLAENVRCCCRRCAEKRFDSNLVASGDQLMEHLGFTSARQTTQAGDTVARANDKVIRPLLILT
jgi:hypothetical protein